LKHFAALLCLGVMSLPAAASSVNLAWNPNPESDIASYQLSYGTSSGVYSNTLATGAGTTAAVSGLEEGRTYYFVVRAINTAGLESPPASELSYQVPVLGTSPGTLISRAGWTVHQVSSEEPPKYAAALAFDGDPATFWHTQWINASTPPPHEIAIDLGVVQPISGFRYLPRQDDYNVGNIGQYEFYVSVDGSNWGIPVASGVFANSKTEKEVLFASTSGRFVKLCEVTEVGNQNACSVAELNIIQGEAIAVTPPPANQAPVAASQTASTAEDRTVAIALAASDADGDPLSCRITSGPAMGTLSGNAPNLTYTPAADVNGTDSFTFVVNDGKTDSNTATVSITIAPVNDAPVAAAQLVSTLEDKAVGILLSASDKDGDPLNCRIVSGPAKGTLSGTAPNLTYTPKADANGSDSFSFLVNDGKADSNTATVSITINPVNDAPVAAAQVISTASDKPVTLVLSASDKDGDPLTYSIASSPIMGTLAGTAPNLTYTPNPDATGSDSFSFRASDGKANSNTASVSISITAPESANSAPVFQSAQISRASGNTAESYVGESLAGTAVDPDGDVVTYSKAAGPEWLVVAPTGEISGIPPAAAEGLNSFTVRATDPKAAFTEATLEITILAAQLPLPWSLGRIGTVPKEATAWGDAVSLKVKSSGSMVGAADGGIIAWQTLSGDGEIVARITTIENANSASRIGLMIRNSLAPNSKHVFIGADGNGSLRWVRRTKTGGSTSSSNAGIGMPPNLWLRLARTGDTIIAYTSLNGSSWNRVSKITVPLGTSSYIGLMVSGGADTLSAGIFQNVTVKP
jgi:hypothetical protein